MYREVAILILLASSTTSYAFYRQERNLLEEVSRECTLEESMVMVVLFLKNPLIFRVLEEQRDRILLHEKWLQKLQNSRNDIYYEE